MGRDSSGVTRKIIVKAVHQVRLSSAICAEDKKHLTNADRDLQISAIRFWNGELKGCWVTAHTALKVKRVTLG